MNNDGKLMLPVKIGAFNAYIPGKIVNNEDIMKDMGHKVEGGPLLYRTVGSKEKRAVEKQEMGSDMLAKVGLDILKQTGTNPSQIDKLICSCDPQDQAAPDTAVVTQMKMGLSCPAFGVSMSCVGWICSLNVASMFIANGDKKILVLSASTVGSKYFFNNPMHRAIFGDAAAGALVEYEISQGNILTIDLMTIGKFYTSIFAPNPWTNVPEHIPTQYKNSFFMAPDNRHFFEALETYVVPFYNKQYLVANVGSDDIKLFVVHQASMPLYEHTLSVLKIPREKTLNYFSKFGNTISAELPLYLSLAVQEGRVKKGDLIFMLTYGAGFTVGAMILRL